MIYEETRQVTLIDYEYASFNPIAFDIANHFCEMAADYHTSTPHVLDFAKYPDIEEQRRFVWTYLSSSGNCKAIREQKIAYSFCTNRALNFMTCLLALHGCIVRILCP